MLTAYIDRLNNSQLNRTIIPSLVQVQGTIVLNENICPTEVPLPIFSVEYLGSIKGEIITFNLDNALRSMKSMGPSFTTLYLWDIEWLRGRTNFMLNTKILRDVNKLICRSEDHARTITNYCNRIPEVSKLNDYIIGRSNQAIL